MSLLPKDPALVALLSDESPRVCLELRYEELQQADR
jgi:hypothetical protein